MPQIILTPLLIFFTLASYLGFRHLYAKYNHPLLNVVVLSAAAVIALLLVCDIPYESYLPAQKIMTFLLGPATVGLAVPLYRYRKLLMRAAPAIIGSVAVGAFIAMFSASVIAAFGGLPRNVVISIMPKGVSIPFAIEVARMYDGDPALASAFVVATGTLGSLLGIWTMNLFRITAPMSRGLALGTVSHAQGTAAALQEGEMPGAMGGLAMILAGILTAAFAPLTVWILERLGV